MGGDYQNIIKKMGLGFASLTGGLALVLGLWIVASALLSPPGGVTKNHLDLSREPAAVPTEIEAIYPNAKQLASNMHTINFDCLNKRGSDSHKESQKILSQSRQVRIKGRVCGMKGLNLSSSSIINRTNGSQATLFQINSNQISTDYLALAKGDNQFIVEFTSDDGKRSVSDLIISF